MNRILMTLGVLVLSVSASRADFQAEFSSTSPADNIYSLHAGSSYFGVMPTGTMNFINSTGTAEGFGPTFSSACGDLFQTVLHGGTPSTFKVVALASLHQIAAPTLGPTEPTNKVNYITELYGRYFSQTNTNTGAAAFQLALWEITHDSVSNLDVTTGNLWVDTGDTRNPTAVLNLSNSWLGTLSGNTSYFQTNYAGSELVGLHSPDSQDQIGIRTIPAPPALFLGFFGVIALGARRWYSRTPEPVIAA